MADLSYYSVRTGRLVEVLFKRKFCSKNVPDISMLCTYIIANNRFTDKQYAPIIIENHTEIDTEIENISDNEFDDLYSDKRKLGPTIIENEFSNDLQLFCKEPHNILEVLTNIGLVCTHSDDLKMYTMEPSSIYYHMQNIKDYNPNRNHYSHFNNSMDISDNNSNAVGKHYSPSTFKPFTQKSYSNNIDDNQNHCKQRSIKKNGTDSNYTERSYNQNRPKLLIKKYWSMRHTLFSKFDEQIFLDYESFYSVCPEILSYHIAKRCKNLIALDPFCGAGGNIIQLALVCKLVIAIDIDPVKIKLAEHNAKIYGVAHKIQFIIGDLFTLAPKLKADVVFMSPPWGGPRYSYQDRYSVESMCNKHNGGGYSIFDSVKSIAPSIAFHMPKTTNIYECLWMARDYGRVEIQQNIINGKLNSITAFFGEFVEVTDDDY